VTLKRLLVLVVPLATAFAGCAWTGIESQVLPTYSGSQFSNIGVLVDLPDPILQRDAEKRFVAELQAAGVKAVAYSSLVPLTIRSSPDERLEIFDDRGADAVLHVFCTSAGSTSFYVPQTSTLTGSVNPATGDVWATSTTYGGYSMSKPWADYVVELIGLRSGDVVWIGYSETRGNAFADSKTLLRSLADKTADQIVKDGVVVSSRSSDTLPEDWGDRRDPSNWR